MSEMTSPREAVPQWDVSDRMRKALRAADLGVQEIADYLGVTRNTVGNWINGRHDPSVQTLRLWALCTGVPFDWLRTGEPAPPQQPPRRPDGLPSAAHNSGVRDDIRRSTPHLPTQRDRELAPLVELPEAA